MWHLNARSNLDTIGVRSVGGEGMQAIGAHAHRGVPVALSVGGDFQLAIGDTRIVPCVVLQLLIGPACA